MKQEELSDLGIISADEIEKIEEPPHDTPRRRHGPPAIKSAGKTPPSRRRQISLRALSRSAGRFPID